MFGLGKKKVDGPLAETRNWYSDRYEFVVIQRNLLFLVTVVALAGAAVAVYTVGELSSSKTISPYIIEVEERTGITTLIHQNSVDKYTKSDSINRYFLWKYITSREGYNVASYEYNYGQVVRLLSTNDVYRTFYAKIAGDSADSPVRLGRNTEKRVREKSVTFLEPYKVQIRIAVDTVREEQVLKTDNRLITLDFSFANLQLSKADRAINPLGFQVTAYSIVEDSQ